MRGGIAESKTYNNNEGTQTEGDRLGSVGGGRGEGGGRGFECERERKEAGGREKDFFELISFFYPAKWYEK